MTRSDAQRRTTPRGQKAPNRRLAELRINAGMSPNALARHARVTGNTIRMIEAGQIPNPRIQLQIARVFDLAPLDLWPLDW